MDLIEQAKTKMRQAIEHLKVELRSIRTGRANPGMVDSVSVEIYGTHMRIKEVASISVPEHAQLLITPFDRSNIPFIVKGIQNANIGINPVVDGHAIRLKVPAMDENMRKEMVKLCHRKLEEAKVSIRNIRRDINDQLKKQKSSNIITEDALKKSTDKIQKETDAFCKEADEVTKQKEHEVTHV